MRILFRRIIKSCSVSMCLQRSNRKISPQFALMDFNSHLRLKFRTERNADAELHLSDRKFDEESFAKKLSDVARAHNQVYRKDAEPDDIQKFYVL